MRTLSILTFMLLLLDLFPQTTMNVYINDGTLLEIPLNTIDSITYTNPDPGEIATLTTTPVTNVISVGAMSGGSISNDGGSTITHRGVCWSTTPAPTTADAHTEDGDSTGDFTSSIWDLLPETTYHVRAYAINSAGTAYGNVLQFTTPEGLFTPGGGVTDIDGNTYPSVIMNNGQEWMAADLRSTTFANGDPIQNVVENAAWAALSTPAYCDHNTAPSTYGRYYNFYAVSDTRNICPTDWHVPSDAEWNDLILFLDPAADPAVNGTQTTVAGGKLKSNSMEWNQPNVGADNETGFNGLPSGLREGWSGGFEPPGMLGRWWTGTSNGTEAWNRTLRATNTEIARYDELMRFGMPVRCVKDQ